MVKLHRWAAFVLLFGTLVAGWSSDAATRYAMPPVPTVFITETGEKYHRSSCRHLKKSRQEISIEEAKERGYEPCGVCKPTN